MNIELLDFNESNTTTVTRTLDVDGKTIIYIEYQNDKGKVIDEELKDEFNNTITDDTAPGHDEAALLQSIHKMFP